MVRDMKAGASFLSHSHNDIYEDFRNDPTLLEQLCVVCKKAFSCWCYCMRKTLSAYVNTQSSLKMSRFHFKNTAYWAQTPNYAIKDLYLSVTLKGMLRNSLDYRLFPRNPHSKCCVPRVTARQLNH